MKKRIVCVLLTLIMLLGLVPMGASAASNKTSEAAITVLKQMTTLKTKCYHYSGSEFRTGYGTVCEEKHSFDKDGNPVKKEETKDGKTVKYYDHAITEKQADEALRKVLTTYDEKVNAFASANGLSLKQNQHDALVVFSYNAGTGWMSGNGVLKSVIINKGTTTEMLNAMNLWTNNASLSRRLVEVNMYMNGIYSNTAPTSYGFVEYDPKGGSMPQHDASDDDGEYTFYFDLNKSMEHPVVPTRAGYKFLGWYVDEGWAPMLKSALDGRELHAKWQKDFIPVEVNYQMHKDHLSSTNVYKKTTDDKRDKALTKEFEEDLKDDGKMFWVDRDLIDKNGTRWSRLKGNNGWVKVGAAVDNDSFEDSNGTVIATATVTVNGYLNLRKEAGTDSDIVGALAKNDTVNIYEIKTVNGHQWGRSKSGWLCLTYTRVIMKDDASVSDEGRLAYTFAGSAKGEVRVHVEPGDNTNYVTYYDPADKLQEPKVKDGSTVTVTNLAVYKNSETWAKITWKHDEWKYTDKKKDKKADVKVSRSGWVKLVEADGTAVDGAHIELNPVKYTVVADSVNVRSSWGDASNLVFTLNKGVQIEADLVALVGENIWGRILVKDPAHVADGKTGYVNLASKYFSRDDAPTLEEDEDTLENLIATVIGTDALKVRKTGATYGQQIGRLTRGTTVAVWEYDDGWYKVDSNKNGEYDYKEDGWCSEKYLDVRKGNVNGNSTVTDASGNQYQTDGTGKGIVANTYSGVNVRTGPGTAHAATGKLLPGTVVEILETANARKWGRVSQGWICMDYVSMVSYNEVVGEGNTNGTTVESFDQAEKTTTTAVYTGRMSADAVIYRNPTKDQENAEEIRDAVAGENITIYELAKVTEVVQSDDEVSEDGNVTTNTTVTKTSYWARINDGWVENPEDCLVLNALDEKVHTQTGATKLNVREGADEDAEVIDILVQGDQVDVTALSIDKDKVWGRIETSEGTGWIRLDYMSEGEVYVKAPVQNNNNNTNQVVLGQGSSTGGYVDNTSGYRYTGKVIRTNTLNVRANPSDTASKTTTLGNGQAMVIYETNTVDGMAWGRCDAGWVYLYYVDLTPVTGAVDARVVANENTIIYTDMNCTSVAGSYAKQAVVDIFEIVGKMARTEQGWIDTDNLL